MGLAREGDWRPCWIDTASFRGPAGTWGTFAVFLTAIFLACTAVARGPPRSSVLTRVPLSVHATTLLVSIPHLLDDELPRGPFLPSAARSVKGEMRVHVKQGVCRRRAARATRQEKISESQ